MKKIILKSSLFGILGTALLLALYFTVLIFISGKNFAISQFLAYWYFIVSLATGFGIQIGLYVYLKNAIHFEKGAGKVLAVSGAASTATMVSCCAHYLVNILPIIGVAGIVSIIGQYQVEFFWIGLAFNLIGIVYIGRKVFKFSAKN